MNCFPGYLPLIQVTEDNVRIDHKRTVTTTYSRPDVDHELLKVVHDAARDYVDEYDYVHNVGDWVNRTTRTYMQLKAALQNYAESAECAE